MPVLTPINPFNSQPEAPPTPWKMPQPLTRVVRWRHHDKTGGRWYTALVVQQDRDSLNLVVLPVGYGGLQQFQEGVKHVDDPSLKEMVVFNPGGVWELSEVDALVHSQAAEIKDLISRVQFLESENAKVFKRPD
jgi:hypothetical protein